MKRAIASAVAIVALVAPATASAATTYEGKVTGDDRATVKMRVSGKGDNRALRLFGVKNLLIQCEDGTEARLTKARITGRAPVSGEGKFSIEGESNGQEFKVAGKLKGKRRAAGTLRYSGPTDVDGDVRECDSGSVRWKASR